MSVNLSPVGGAGAQFCDNNGNPLNGGKLYTYGAGTTTPAATYTSAAGSVFHPNPIILNAGGRVPDSGEIWLADNISYKFVLKTSADVLIATWDNINGINSNFVNYTIQEEVITATSGQTVFNLSTITYAPGTNSLAVYIDGVNQIVTDSYIETDSNTVTFVSGLHEGALVKFTTAVPATGTATNADVVAYDPPFTGAVATTVEAKLAQTVSVKDFGAVGDGVTDDTAAIQAAIDAAYGIEFPHPSVSYRITSPLIGHSNLALYPVGKAKIFYDASTGVVISLTNCDDVSIKGLEIESAAFTPDPYPTGLTDNNIVEVLGGSNIEIDNNIIYGAGRDAVYVGYGTTYPTNVRITNNNLGTSKRNGISVVSGSEVQIRNNKIVDYLLVGLDVEPNAGQPRLANVLIDGNYVENTLDATSAGLQATIGAATKDSTKFYNVQITNNTVIGSETVANASLIRSYGFYGTVIDGNIVNNYTNGISVDNDDAGSVVSNNVLSKPGTVASGSSTYAAINITGKSTCVGNNIDGSGYNGIYAVGADGSVITDNTITNPGQLQASVAFNSEGIYLNQSNSVVVCNNTVIDNQGSPTMRNGIYVRYNAGPPTYGVDNIISGNSVSGATNFNINVGASQFQKLFRGNSDERIARNNSIPSSGTFELGATIYNSDVAYGEPMGWMCTTAGTPGTWTPFAQLGVISSVGSTPSFVGQLAVVAGDAYMAVGTSSAADWKKITP